MRALVIGATGQIGYAVCRRLLDAGYEVVASHRGRRPLQEDLRQSGCQEVIGDRHESKEFARVLGSGADLVVDVVPMTSRDADQLVSSAAGIGTIVAISSCAVYADEQGRSLGSARETGFPEFPDFIEESQQTVEPDEETYAGRKVAVERRLLDGCGNKAVILRPGTIHGVYARDLREVWFLKRIVDRRPFAPLAYMGRSRIHTCAASTIAAAAVAGFEAGATGVFNLGDGDAPSVREIGETLIGPAGRMELIFLPGPPIKGVGDTPWSVPRAMRLDTSRLSALMGQPPVYAQSVRETVEWALSQLVGDWQSAFQKLLAIYPPLFDYEAEDALVGNCRPGAEVEWLCVGHRPGDY